MSCPPLPAETYSAAETKRGQNSQLVSSSNAKTVAPENPLA
jgi:hypothetical protein